MIEKFLILLVSIGMDWESGCVENRRCGVRCTGAGNGPSARVSTA